MTDPHTSDTLFIFPVKAVLFPASTLALTVLETRYQQMVCECARNAHLFGINLLHSASQETEATLSMVGVSARVLRSETQQSQTFEVLLQGERRYRITDSEINADGLRCAQVEWLSTATVQTLPEGFESLTALMTAVILDQGTERFPPPHALTEVEWLGTQLASILPIPLAAKQALLELDDGLSRLEIIRTFLRQHGMIKR